MLTPLDEHQLLVFWTQLLVLVATARLLGSLLRRVGLPSVVGELTAGLLLGPSVFGKVWPSGFEWFLPDDEMSSAALLAVGWVGVALLLVVAGFETDLGLIRRLGRAALLVTACSLLLPLAGGLVVGFLLPDGFVGADSSRTVFALFLAAALAVSSLAVVAKILGEMGLMRRDFGQITVAAGMANDVVGWLMLAVFAGLATSGSVSVAGVLTTVIGMALFLGLALTVGQRLVDWVLRQVRQAGGGLGGALTTAVFTTLGFGVATQALGVEAVLGAFVAGVLLHRSRFQDERVVERIESLTVAFLAPVFFATAGLRVDIGLLDEPEALLWAGVVVAVALVFKFVGSYVGARLAGQSRRAGVALGAGLNARGALEIVIATVGLSLGVFSDVAYTVIVLVPIVTSVFASVGLRLTVRGWRGSPDEQERLEREEAFAKNLVVRSSRVLLPSLGGPASINAAQVVHFAWPPESEATVVSVRLAGLVGDEGDSPDLSPVLNVLWDRKVEHRTLEASDVGEMAGLVAAEAKLGFGVICVGVAEHHERTLFSPFVDELLHRATIPVMIVRRARGLDRPLPPAFSRALVPVTGGRGSRAAQEVAFSISADLGTDLVLTHVVNRPQNAVPWPFGRSLGDDPIYAVAEGLMAESVDRAEELGVRTRTTIREGVSTADELVTTCEQLDVDLVVLGATIRSVDGRPFLGHHVETVLENSDATVVVVALPRVDES